MAVASDVARAYARPRRTARLILSKADTESRALALVMTGCAFLFIAQFPELILQGQTNAGHPTLAAMAAGRVIGTLLFAPLLFYFLAGTAGALMRLLGRQISWLHSRVSLFWAVLAASPLVLIEAVARGLQLNDLVQQAVSVVTIILFAAFWVSGLVESTSLARRRFEYSSPDRRLAED